VVITGAGSGMGRELAMRYAKRNCKVVIADIQLNKLKEV
jgi:NAD(P)-dependent dehydrogenase (short-subunit alcohol dehydrogenase family)